MSHIDEGTLHAYLDGELSRAERAELERHLSVCVPCRNAFAEAQGFLAESDHLVQALDAPMPAGIAVATIPAMTSRRFFRPATLAWAASILVAIGLGYSIRNTQAPATETTAAPVALPTPPVDHPMIAAGNSPAPAPAVREHRTDDLASNREAPAPAATGRADAHLYSAEQPSPAPSTATAGTGVTTLSSQPAAPEPAVAQARTAKAAAPSTVAMIDGVPVDTTMSRRAFGPANPPAPRRITMDEAVNHLGGTIRLIDGLAPQRVELLAGVDVPGADPSREVVRIYYEEPDLGLVTLDQQRPGPSFAARGTPSEIDPSAVSSGAVPSFRDEMPRQLARSGVALASLSWRQDGTWMSLTSRLTKDQMASLQARVK